MQYNFLCVALVELLTDWWPVELSFSDKLKNEGVILLDNVIYYSNNPTEPEVGDVRLRYEAAGHAGSSRPDHVRDYFMFSVFVYCY